MTVLSDKEILSHLKRGELDIAPFEPSCLNPAGYDLRSADELVIEPKHYRLTATLETIKLGLKVLASLHIRSSLAREGIIGSFAAIDPGFRGQLTLNLHNNGENTVTIKKGEPIVQIVFHKLGNSAAKGYSGVYQDSKGIVKSKRTSLQRRRVTKARRPVFTRIPNLLTHTRTPSSAERPSLGCSLPGLASFT